MGARSEKLSVVFGRCTVWQTFLLCSDPGTKPERTCQLQNLCTVPQRQPFSIISGSRPQNQSRSQDLQRKPTGIFSQLSAVTCAPVDQTAADSIKYQPLIKDTRCGAVDRHSALQLRTSHSLKTANGSPRKSSGLSQGILTATSTMRT